MNLLKKSKWALPVLIGIFLLLTLPARAWALSFTADMVETRKGASKTSRFYLLDHQYRLDAVEDGRDLHILVNRKTGKTRILVPEENVFLEMDNSDMQSLMNNPFEAHQYMIQQYEVKTAGKETINGLSCEKQIISANGKEMMTAWIATRYNFLVKLENQKGDRTLVLENIRDNGAAPSLFAIPAGTKRVTAMPIAPPDWAGDIAGAPLMRPPFEMTLSEGTIIRIKPRAGYAIRVIGKSAEEKQPVTLTTIPFKNGRPLKKLSTGTFNLKFGSTTSNHKEKPSDADEIIVRAKKGRVAIKSQWIEAPEGIILKKAYHKAHSGKDVSFDETKTARLMVTDDPSDGKPSKGSVTFVAMVPKPQDGGTFYVRQERQQFPYVLKTGETRTWQVEPKDKISGFHIDVVQGGVNSRIEQPEKAGTIPPLWAKTPQPTAPAAPPSKTITPPAVTRQKKAPAKTPQTKAADAGPVRMVLVLDASGSMWGQINNKAKIAIAKEVMAELIDQLPGNFQTGLTVYGHRRKGDCSDIEMVIPVGPHNPAKMKAKIQAISPKGKTPLSAAVKQAAQALRYTEERATVLLVSDGLETCDIDPCELAAELAMSGVDFTVHVIGFDISKEDQLRLRCLADKTGGLFLAADNAGSLRDALFKTVDKVKQPPPPVVEDPGTATLSGPASVPAGSEFKVNWEGPDSQRDYIAVAEKGTKDLHHRDYTYTKRGNPAEFVAPGDVGDYELRYVHGHTRKVIGRTSIKVTPVQASVQAPTSADVAPDIEVSWQGPAYKSDYIALSRPDQKPGRYVTYTYTSRGNPLKVRAPSDPGTYEVRYMLGRGNKLLAKTTIEIKGVTAKVEAPDSADVATDFEVSWQGPDSKSDYICVSRPDQKPGRYVTYTYTSRGNPLTVRAPSDPGTYEVRYILGRGNKLLATTTIEIKGVTAKVEAPDSANVASEFEVNWQGPDSKSDYICVSRPDQKPGRYVTYTYTSRGNPLKVQAPSDPGAYEVRYMLGRGNKLLAKTTIDIKAVTANVTSPPAADMGSEFEVSWQGPNSKSDYICVSRPDQKPGRYVTYTYTSRGNPLKVRAPSDPGDYEVRYILGRGSKLLAKTTINIKAVTAQVTAPQTAGVATEFEVNWQGPGYKSDYICVSQPDQKPGRYVTYTYISRGNPVRLKAPKQPGNYEIRYIMARGNKLLATVPITIEP